MASGNAVLEDIQRIKREITSLSKMQILVGIQGDEDSEVLMIANVHEFGLTFKMTDKMRRYLGAMGLFDDSESYNPPAGHQTGYINIPERSFIRASFASGKQGIDATVKMAVDRIGTEKWTAQQAADMIGAFCVQATQSFIDDGKVTPPNSEFTLANKSQKTTLYDSGTTIRDRITYKIEGGSS